MWARFDEAHRCPRRFGCMEMTMSIVECENVRKVYRQGQVEVQALTAVTLSVEQGEFVALAGPSGSGKTTLLNLIGGLDATTSGTIRVDGQTLGGMSQTELAEMRLHKVGFIFQSYNLIPVLSAQENVEFVMLLRGVPVRERTELARSMLKEVGLEGMFDRRPSQLSGGQQQRVAVARAIVSNPSIVLADEPTANLDSGTGSALLDIMKELNESKGITFVFSTHDSMVMDYARRLVMLRDGRVVEDRRN
jgi:putative ABC transport system ATP-binding protein